MWIRRLARARLIERLLVFAVLVSMLPTSMMPMLPSGGLAAAPAAAAPKTGDPTSIWACEQQHGGTLRLVGDKADCAKSERAVNLNDPKTPVRVCVGNDDQVLRLAREAKGGNGRSTCDSGKETSRKVPGDAPTQLCARQEGDLTLCAKGSEPDVIVPARNQSANAGDNDRDDDSAADTDPAKTDPAKEKSKQRASKRDRRSAHNQPVDTGDDQGDDPGAGTDPAAGEQPQEPSADPTAGGEPEQPTTEPAKETGKAATESDQGPAGELTAIVAEGDAPIWACKQQGGPLLRAVASKADCSKKTPAVNLNNRKHPIGVCVADSDQALMMKRSAKKGGSRPRDCGETETFLKLPGDAEAKLCAREDGFLVLCADDPNPDVTVSPRNQLPVAVADAGAGFGTDEDTKLTTGGVLTNDSDADGDELSITAVDKTNTKGNVANKGDGIFAYEPDGQFEALAVNETDSDQFAYTISDGHGGEATATVTIQIAGINDPPIAVNDKIMTDETRARGIRVRLNDSDPDTSDTLTVTDVDTTGTIGTVENQGTRVVYDPDGKFGSLAPGKSTVDTFTYTVSDGNGGSDTATVEVTINGLNVNPTAEDDSGDGFRTEADSQLTTGSVLTNDSDADGDSIAVVDFSQTDTKGAVTNNGDGTFGYDPSGAFEALGFDETGTDTFAYTVSDGHGGTDTATVTVVIDGVNDDPNARDDTGSTGARETTTIDLLANDDDPDEFDDLRVTEIDRTGGTKGKVTDNGDGTVTYDPDRQFEGLAENQTATDTFGYTVSDRRGGTATATVEVTITGRPNLAPAAVDDHGDDLATGEDTAVVVTPDRLLANDSDAEGDSLSVSAVTKTNETKGEVTTGAGGAIAYDPNGQFDGLPVGGSDTDSFEYTLSDGRGGTDTAIVTIKIDGANDAPVLTNVEGDALGFSEGDDPKQITSTLKASDIDGTTIAGATIEITDNYQQGEDLLAFDDVFGITGDFDAGTLTLTGDASVADYEAALRAVTYTNTSENPDTAARTVSFQADDGGANGQSDAVTREIAVSPVNDAPALSGIETSVLAATEQVATTISADIAVSDADSADLTGATVSISANYVEDEDVLAFTDTADITGSFNANTGTLALSGTASVADYQDALRAVTYTDTVDNPNSTDTRTVTFQVNDGEAANNLSNTETRDITVIPANEAPVLDDIEVGALAFTEGGDATPITGTLSVTDVDSANLKSATVTIGAGYQSGADILAFASADGITGSFSAGTLTLTGSATPADYESALQAVTYTNTSNAPSTATRTITFQVDDGAADHNLSNEATRDIAVTAVNSAPVLANLESNTLAFGEGDDPTAVTTTITVTDADSADLTGATVSISANYVEGEDILAFVAQDPIAGTFEPETGVLTLSGTASVASYEAALRTITYDNLSDTPSTAVRTVSFVVDDGGAANNLSDTKTRTIAVTPANEAPVLANIETAPLGFSEGDDPKPVTGTLTVADVDSTNLSSATVKISAGYQSGADFLAFADTADITGSFSAGTLTLTGTASLTDYEDALQAVTYTNTSDNPSTAARTLTFQANDGATENNLSDTVTRNITVTAVNDAPALSGIETSALSATEQVATIVSSTITVADVDSANLSNATVTISDKYVQGEDVLGFVTQGPISGSFNATSGVLTLSGTASPGAYQTALRAVTYTDTSDNPNSTDTRTVTFRVNDGGAANNLSNEVSRSVKVLPVNDPPTGVVNVSHAVTGNVRIQVPDGPSDLLVGVTDPEGDALTAQVDGTSAPAGTVTIAGNGSYIYNPKAGREGADTVKFKVCDNGAPVACSAVRDLTLNVSGMLWFIDNSKGAAGDGRLSSPFNSLPGFTAVNNGTGDNPAAGEVIFIDRQVATAYTGPLTLLNNQKVLGKGASVGLASFAGITLAPDSDPLPSTSGTRPSITTSVTATNGITLGSSNTLRGVNVGDTTGADISGTNFGTLTVSEISVTGAGQALNLTTGTLAGTFDEVSSTGGTNGVALTTVNGTPTITAGSLAGVSGATLLVSGGNVSFTWTGGLTQANNAPLVSVAGGHTGTLTFQTGTLSASNGTGLQFDNADGTYNVNGTTTLNGGDAGVDILNGSGGTFSFGTGTSITNPSGTTAPAGTAFNLSGSNANVTYSGSISDNTGFAVDIDNHDLGTVTFQTGSIASTGQGLRVQNSNAGTVNFNNPTKTLNTGANAAVTLSSNNGSTINFTGGALDIDTTSGTGFSATGGGIVTVGTGANPNTIEATSGVALNVANTTIGASGLTFRSISAGNNTAAADPANGIVLNNTGSSGGLTVSGNGGTCSTLATCTGGAIQNATGSGVSLTNVGGGVSLTRMIIIDSVADGVTGTTVAGGFNLDNATITSNGTNSAAPGGGVHGDHGVDFTDLTGTSTFTNSNVSDNRDSNVVVSNNSGILNLNVTGGTYSGATGGMGDGIFVEGLGTGSQNLNVQGPITFANNVGDHIQHSADAVNTTDSDVTVNNATMTSPAAAGGGPFCALNILGGGITISHGGSSNTDATLTNNNIQNSCIGAIAIGTTGSVGDQQSAQVDVTIQNNTIGTAGVAGSGSVQGNGIFVDSNGNGLVRALITGNTIRQWTNRSGIALDVLDGDAEMSATIRNNIMTEPNSAFTGTTTRGMTIQLGSGQAGDSVDVCLDIGDAANNALKNQVFGTGEGIQPDVRYLHEGPGSVVQLVGYAGPAAPALSNIQGWFQPRNNLGGTPTVTGIATATGGSTTTGVTSCALPAA